jgi:selenocysteine lyase/cysteine desulfurase
VGLGASVQLFLDLGPAEIERWALDLTAAAAAGLAERGYRVVSSSRPEERSTIISVERDGVDADRLEAVLREAGVIGAVREGRLRLSLHGYNDESDVERLLAALPG